MPVLVLAAFPLLCIFALPLPTRAATITVTNLNDSGAGFLRQAVADANSGDDIRFEVTGTITLTSGQIAISKNLTITGPGARTLTIDGNGDNRIFNQSAGTFSLTGLTLTNVNGTACVYSNNSAIRIADCRLEGISGRGVYLDGGSGDYTIARCLVTNCYAGSGNPGAGIACSSRSDSVINCTISGNTAEGSGGGTVIVGGTAKISHCTIVGNESKSLYGGGGVAVWSGGTVRLRNTIVAGNTDSSVNNRPNLSGTITSEGYNLVGDDTGGTWSGGHPGHGHGGCGRPRTGSSGRQRRPHRHPRPPGR